MEKKKDTKMKKKSTQTKRSQLKESAQKLTAKTHGEQTGVRVSMPAID